MATYICAGNNTPIKSGEYLYETFVINGMSPYATVDKTIEQWSIGEYSSSGGDTLQIARWQWTSSSGSYTINVSYDASVFYDGAYYDYVGSIASSLTASPTLPPTQTTTLRQYTLSVSQYGGLEWCVIPVYIARACILTCDGNGGTPATQTVDFRSGIAFRLPDAPSRAGYSFAGWNIDGTIYRAGNEFTSSTSTTAVAQWSSFPPPPSPGSGSILCSGNSGSLIFNPNSGFLIYN